MVLDLSSLTKAIRSFKAAVAVACSKHEMDKLSADAQDTIKAGVIQNFEFTYELCWKFMKRSLSDSLGGVYVDGVSRRELFRLASEHRLISNVDKWMEYHDQRNETSHAYDKETAEEVFAAAVRFIDDAEELLANLEKQNH